MPEDINTIQSVEEWLYSRVLYWFQEFLTMSEEDLKYYIDQYNGGYLGPTLSMALEAIDQMSG